MLTVYLCEDHPEELDFFKETILKILGDFSGKSCGEGHFPVRSSCWIPVPAQKGAEFIFSISIWGSPP